MRILAEDVNSPGILTPIENYSNITLTEHESSLSRMLNISFAKPQNDLVPVNPLKEKGRVYVFDGFDEFVGAFVILRANFGKDIDSFTAFDNGFYLDNNQDIFQCKKQNVFTFLRSSYEKLGFIIGRIDSVGVNITLDKDYIKYSLTEITNDIFDEIEAKTGKEMFIKVGSDGTINFLQKDLRIKTDYKIDVDGLREDNITDIIGRNISDEIDYTRSRNSIKVYSKNKKEGFKTTVAQNQTLINEIGLLQQVVEFESENFTSSKLQAEQILSKRELPKQLISFEILGNLNIRVYDLLQYFTDELVGIYEVVSISQSVSDSTLRGTLTLREVVL